MTQSTSPATIDQLGDRLGNRLGATKVKVCGITRVGDAEAASALGADAIGLVFYPPSSRYLDDLGRAREIVAAAGPFVSSVGLFVDAEAAQIEAVLARVPLALLQFHGDESEADCLRFGRPYIKAIRMREGLDIEAAMATYPSAAGFLLDAYVKGKPGGTGERFDWDRVPPSRGARHIIVAGGLDADNVRLAIQTSVPYGVDVSGGVESAPGIKDSQKMQSFISRAKLES